LSFPVCDAGTLMTRDLYAFEDETEDRYVFDSLVLGGTFALDMPDGVPAFWGDANQVLWAKGEPFLVNGPPGVGKTTLAHKLILASIGIGPNKVLGLSVAKATRPILYIAADRPRQSARALRRSVAPKDRALLDRFLLVRQGPLGFDIAKEPRRLAAWGCELGVGTIIIDSLKDVASRLSDDEVGGGVNQAFQRCVAADIDLLALHHQRKGQSDNRKPSSLDDVYGSTWITAGAGSVVLLWGKPGDPIVELSHLKQPAEEVGPWSLLIDHPTGHVAINDGGDELAVLRSAPEGLTGPELAARIYVSSSKPSRAEIEKAKRKLERLHRQGQARREDVPLDGKGARTHVVRYFAAVPA
jgi:replicative DNA helicase